MSDTVDLDKAIREHCGDHAEVVLAPDLLANAITALLDKARAWETDFEGKPSIYGRAFADEVRNVVARELGVAGG